MRNTIRFEYVKSMDDFGEISMTTMRRKLANHYRSEYSDKTAMSRLIDMKIDKMIGTGETLHFPDIEYRYIPSTEIKDA